MSTMKKIRNTFKSFEGRRKALEDNPDVDLETYHTVTSWLEHEFYNVIKRILENEGTAENASSLNLAERSLGLIDE